MMVADIPDNKRVSESYWEHFSHDADMGVRGVGETLEGAFEQAALAMTAIQVPDLKTIRLLDEIAVTCTAPDWELLLVDWLNALVYEMATRGMVFGRFKVRITEDALMAQVFGEVVDRSRHQLGAEVKGATYTALKVVATDDGRWLAQCIVDV